RSDGERQNETNEPRLHEDLLLHAQTPRLPVEQKGRGPPFEGFEPPTALGLAETQHANRRERAGIGGRDGQEALAGAQFDVQQPEWRFDDRGPCGFGRGRATRWCGSGWRWLADFLQACFELIQA